MTTMTMSETKPMARKIRKSPEPSPNADPFCAACGLWISAAIEASQMSAADLKRGHGLSEAKLSEYRNGLREPKLRTLARISAVTGFDLRPLMVKLKAIAEADLASENS